MKKGYLEQSLQDNYLGWQGRYASSSILFLSGYSGPFVLSNLVLAHINKPNTRHAFFSLYSNKYNQ